MKRWALVLSLLVTGNAAAQAIPRYQPPAGSTLSPYLGLLRNNGALPSYYAFVRPFQSQQQLQRETRNLQRETRRLDRAVNDDLLQNRALPTGTNAGFLTVRPGVNSPFGNRGAYYRVFDIRRQRRR